MSHRRFNTHCLSCKTAIHATSTAALRDVAARHLRNCRVFVANLAKLGKEKEPEISRLLDAAGLTS